SANNQVFVPSKVIDDGLFSNTTDATDVTCRRRPYEGCDNANAAFTVPPVLCGTPAPGRHRKRHPAMLRLRFLLCSAGHPHPVGTASATRPCCAYGSSCAVRDTRTRSAPQAPPGHAALTVPP